MMGLVDARAPAFDTLESSVPAGKAPMQGLKLGESNKAAQDYC